jgi:hypothetical protein
VHPACPMSWSDLLSFVNAAGLVAAVCVVVLSGAASLLFRRW